jgi:hypothetical protein
MELEKTEVKARGVAPNVSDFSRRRTRSGQRLRFEAQVRVFETQYGTLEAVRQTLGLRPSQMCELLKVHPSAWIRWTRSGTAAPPHVYQMLEWYLELLKWRGQYRGPSGVKAAAAEDPAAYPPTENQVAPQILHSRVNAAQHFQKILYGLGALCAVQLALSLYLLFR